MTGNDHPHDDAATTEMWRQVLEEGHEDKPSAFLPGSKRCSMCMIPLSGVGGAVLKALRGRSHSRKNPAMCNLWDDILPTGGAEIDIAVIFADVRGSTAIAEKVGPTDFAALLNRFYKVAMDALIPQKAIVDKMIGDEVMAFFVPAWSKDLQVAAMNSATSILRGVGYGSGEDPWLPVGIGINFGQAYVGKVGTGEVNDFTALGDTVNTAARLQGHAKAGEVVVSESVYTQIADEYPDVPVQNLDVRGKAETFGVHVITPMG